MGVSAFDSWPKVVLRSFFSLVWALLSRNLLVCCHGREEMIEHERTPHLSNQKTWPPFIFVCWFISKDLRCTYSWSFKLLFQCQISFKKERPGCILFQDFYVGCMEGMLLYAVTSSLWFHAVYIVVEHYSDLHNKLIGVVCRILYFTIQFELTFILCNI